MRRHIHLVFAVATHLLWLLPSTVFASPTSLQPTPAPSPDRGDDSATSRPDSWDTSGWKALWMEVCEDNSKDFIRQGLVSTEQVRQECEHEFAVLAAAHPLGWPDLYTLRTTRPRLPEELLLDPRPAAPHPPPPEHLQATSPADSPPPQRVQRLPPRVARRLARLRRQREDMWAIAREATGEAERTLGGRERGGPSIMDQLVAYTRRDDPAARLALPALLGLANGTPARRGAVLRGRL